MATTILSHPDTQSAEVGVPTHATKSAAGFEIDFSGGVTRQFGSAEAVRAAILRGEVPKAAPIRALGASRNSKAIVVEDWARSNSRLRSIYAPVWSSSLKGAVVGLIVVGILKSLDSLVLLFSVNPPAAILWLLVGAGIFSPKWKAQFMAAALFASFKTGIPFMTLWGAWFGVAAFAAVFGISAGMPVGTIVGLLRAKNHPTAPDANSEGSKPVIWGLAVPLAVFVTAAVAYVQLIAPALLNVIKG
jgi:hypothetical protein